MLALPDVMHPRVPARVRRSILAAAVAQCEARRDRVVFIDSPSDARDLGKSDPTISNIKSSYAAVYGPWLEIPVSKRAAANFLPPSGHVAGIYARNDNQHGVWKASSGAQAEVRGITGLSLSLIQKEIESLAGRGLNAIRDFRNAGRGMLLWDARTRSADPDWKYVNIRRYITFLENSIDRGLPWVVFEPNGEALWANVRATVQDFLLNQWQNGALQGARPDHAFFVRCDRTTMTQNDIDNGRLVCLIGVAPVKPAEFVIFRIGLWTAKKPCQRAKARRRVVIKNQRGTYADKSS